MTIIHNNREGKEAQVLKKKVNFPNVCPFSTAGATGSILVVKELL